MGKRNGVKHLDKEDNSGLLGFAVDTLKVIFKLSPDKDQTIGEFIMEKLGAITLFLVVLAIILGIIFALWFDRIVENIT